MRVIILFFLFLLTSNLAADERAFSILPKKTLNISRLGANAFVNDSRFGTIKRQFREVKSVLGIKYVRVLFAWNDQVQPLPNSAPNFSFYDDIANSLPSGVEALVILTGLPSWMSDSSNWVENNPRKTFIEKWVKKVASRYKKNRKIKAFQIWNEQNMEANPDNSILDIADSPVNYVELLQYGFNVIKSETPKKIVVSGATTAINQNFPETIEYNQAMLQAGAEQYLDIWAIHFYGSHIENVLRPDGVEDFSKKLSKPIWITESGAQGVNNQQSYARRYWPFLLDIMPAIKRIYVYQFSEASNSSITYGLKNLTQGSYLSDLYIYLRDLKKRNR